MPRRHGALGALPRLLSSPLQLLPLSKPAGIYRGLPRQSCTIATARPETVQRKELFRFAAPRVGDDNRDLSDFLPRDPAARERFVTRSR